MAPGEVLRTRENQLKPPDRTANNSSTAHTGSALEPISSSGKLNTGNVPISPKKMNMNQSGKNM